MSSPADAAAGLNELEDRRHDPGAPIDLRRTALRQDAGQIFRNPAPGDVREPLHVRVLEQRTDERQITAMRRKQRGAGSSLQFPDERIGLQAGDVEEDAPGKRISVGMQPGRWQANQNVSRHDASAVDDLRPLDRADDEARNVVFAVSVEAWHLRGLSTDQGAPVLPAGPRDAADDLLGNIRGQPSRREVVEEKQRLGSLDENVIDAMIHEIARQRCRGGRS